MCRLTVVFLLFCHAITYAASSDGWVSVGDEQQEGCVHENDACARMVFGTVHTPEGGTRTIFIPPRDQVKRLMRVLQSHTMAHLAQKKGMRDQDMAQNVMALYPMPNTALGAIYPVFYKKYCCIRPELTGFPEGYALFQTPEFTGGYDVASVRGLSHTRECYIVFNDAFNTGRTEFQIAAKILDEVLPYMTQEQCANLHIVIAAVYLQNGGEEEASVRFDGQDYPIGVVKFRGNVRERLMMHAKLHVMNSYLTESEKLSWRELIFENWLSAPKPSKKEKILSLSKEERGQALREIFEKDSALEQMASDRYLSYIASDVIYELSVNDFVVNGWIDQGSADNLQIAMPETLLSDEKILDLEPPLRNICQKKSIKHFLEPMFYLQHERMLLDAPVIHNKILEACTDFPGVHDANLLTLTIIPEGHHRVKKGWLRACKSRLSWAKGETIGVVLYDPYVKGMERGPTEASHPHLLDDIVAGMQEDLLRNGYNVQFFHLSHHGDLCVYPVNPLAYENYPKARPKQPLSCHFVCEPLRITWTGKGSPKEVDVYSDIRYSS